MIEEPEPPLVVDPRYRSLDEHGPFASDRYFQVWTYTVSHCRLLLRSTRGEEENTRVDVYFGGVDRMFLRPYYEGLRVTSANPSELAAYRQRYGELGRGHQLFVLEPELESFVVAGVMQWYEDEGSHSDPSPFGHFLGA